jgi:hypothetical protein
MRLVFWLCLMVVSAMMTSSAWSEQRAARVALVIANANYPDASTPLSTTIGDARTLAEEFRRNGFEVDRKENLGKADMQRAIDALTGKIRPGMTALFYFNGYGIQVARQTYLIPVNAQVWTEKEVQRDGISLDDVLAEIHRKGAKVKIIIVDAARRNPYERRFRAAAAGLATIDAPENTLTMFSAGPGRLINDRAGTNSLFVIELVKELRAPNVTAEEVFNRVRVGVSRASNNEQIPWVASSLVEQFYFGSPAPVEAASPPAKDSVDPDKSCVQLSQTRSPPTREPVNLTFSNKTNDEVSIIWLDFNGNQKLYRKLTPGQQYTQRTFQDHAWLVNDSKGHCVGIFRAGPTRTVELK